MTSKYLYLLIDLLVLAVPLAVSVHPKSNFYKHWKNAGLGLIITVVFFLLWDVVFVQLGVRSVNERYITGVYIGPLPVEEVLFFVAYSGEAEV